MRTVALELVPPELNMGRAAAVEEGRKVTEVSKLSGLDGVIKHVMIPGMIDEDDDRPVPLRPRMDVLDFWTQVRPALGDMRGLCTQVTAFDDKATLSERLETLRDADMDGVIFVGVPRTMADGEGPGVAPVDALSEFADVVPERGAILIPTRQGEQGRFRFKCDRGATFGMTQLLFSDAIVPFLAEFAKTTDHRPDLLLSFGFVPGVEQRIRLINWLIQDPGNPAVAAEQEFVGKLSAMSFADKKRALVDLYKRVVDGVNELGFNVSIHLEAPYGVSKPAFDTFAEMLAHYNPVA